MRLILPVMLLALLIPIDGPAMADDKDRYSLRLILADASLDKDGKNIDDEVIDTGASDIVLSESDAELLGYPVGDLIYSGRASTANGTVPIARVKLDTITLGRFTDRNIRATVNGGELDTSLLGMRYLSRFHKIEIMGSTMTLTR